MGSVYDGVYAARYAASQVVEQGFMFDADITKQLLSYCFFAFVVHSTPEQSCLT